jgi:hypothetical protein
MSCHWTDTSIGGFTVRALDVYGSEGNVQTHAGGT